MAILRQVRTIVNFGWHMTYVERHLFTLLAVVLLGTVFGASSASADRVVLLPAQGEEIHRERLDDIEDAVAEAIVATGHEALTESGVSNDAAPPTTANEMRAVAEIQNAQYLVIIRATIEERSYRLQVRVGYAPETRVEELEALVYFAGEEERLRDIFAALLRPEGLGEDAVRLTQDPQSPEAAAAEEERRRQEEEEARRREEEERAREEFLERERQRELEAQQTAEERWENRERYGTPQLWVASLGADIRPIIANDSDRRGGVLGGASLRLGRSFPQIPGLEARVAFDLSGGAQNSIAFAAGAVYALSPFEFPLHIGGTLELGYHQALSGNRVPGFLVRGGPVFIWRPFSQIYLEAQAPEFMFISSNNGVLTLGASVRAGVRF
ncbi:MAG: hypothetical protein AAGF12_13110 [Myxococcota bacterium]